MSSQLPRIIVTGASGLVGRHFVEAIRNDFVIYALARRTQQEGGVREHPNIRWIQVDIANAKALEAMAAKIALQGPIRFLVHLAGFYDFSYEENPEYERTNISGMRNVLEMAKALEVERVLFASSLAACEFPRPEGPITEETPADADFAYARSKLVGEGILREYSAYFGTSVIRLAAVVTDWCEYPPLFFFIDTWLSGGWNARILGGRGETGITYIHVRDLIRLFLAIMRRSSELPAYQVYNASPDGTVTHAQLYELANQFFYGRARSSIGIPKWLAWPGVLARDLLGRLIGRRPFERPWMLQYLDRQLVVDSRRTREELGWEPAAHDHVLRRLLFMIENMSSHPVEWRTRNEEAFRHVAIRPNLLIYEELMDARRQILDDLNERVIEAEDKDRFTFIRSLARPERRQYVRVIYSLLMASIRTFNRSLLLDYIDELTPTLFAAGARPAELNLFLDELNDALLTTVASIPELKDYHQEAHSYISLTLQLARDQVEVAHEEFLRFGGPEPATVSAARGAATEKRDSSRIIDELYAFYQLSPQSELALEDLQQLLVYMENKKNR